MTKEGGHDVNALTERHAERKTPPMGGASPPLHGEAWVGMVLSGTSNNAMVAHTIPIPAFPLKGKETSDYLRPVSLRAMTRRWISLVPS